MVDAQTENAPKTGWIDKKSKYSHKWVKTWISVQPGEVLYSKSKTGPYKKIKLDGTSITDVESNGKTFRLQCQTSKREYIFKVEEGLGAQVWLEAICVAKVSEVANSTSSTCILQ
uniref:Uncharacterized LOC100177385 n=1 Tax=Ciona intestinalis TaxID=7719 RepID=F6QVQ7_CIOIN